MGRNEHAESPWPLRQRPPAVVTPTAHSSAASLRAPWLRISSVRVLQVVVVTALSYGLVSSDVGIAIPILWRHSANTVGSRITS